MTKFIEPEDLLPAAVGVAIGVAILVFFVALASMMNLQMYIDPAILPRQ